MNQQEIFEYIKKQYPATPERITQNGKQITIFKNQRNNIPYAIFYQSDESVMSIMEVQAESDMISNYIEMYHLAPAKYMNQKHWLAVPMDGTVRDMERTLVNAKTTIQELKLKIKKLEKENAELREELARVRKISKV